MREEMKCEYDSSPLHTLRRLSEKYIICRTCSVTQQGKGLDVEPDNQS